MKGGQAAGLILGAGLAGAAVAYHLARLRVGRVVALESRTPAAGATGRAAGIVSEMLWDRWDVEVVRASKEEYAALATKVDPAAYRVNGFVRWTRDERIAEALTAGLARWRAWGVDVRPLERDGLARAVPGIRADDVRAAVLAPRDSVVAPSGLAEAYVREGRALGVDWTFGAATEGLRAVPEGWQWSDRTSTVTAPVAVVAAGAWSKRLLASIGHPLPLTPYRTQAAVLRPAEPVPEHHPSVHDLDTDVYARPEEQGRLLAGDGTERVEADPERFHGGGDAAFVAHLAESFATRLPAWAGADLVRAWAGVCVATPDRRPLIGPVPNAPGLYVITGFNGFGVMRAGGAARRLAEAIASGVAGPSPGLATVDPGRFPGPVNPFPPKPGFTLEAGNDPRY